MALTYRFRRIEYLGLTTPEVVIESDGMCDGPHWNWVWEDESDTSKGGRNTDEPAATLAHVGFEIIAQVLAAPLRRAFEDHWNRPHLDAATPEFRAYRAHCPECIRLTAMLPEGDRPVAYG
jgi:hypothetical protein